MRSLLQLVAVLAVGIGLRAIALASAIPSGRTADMPDSWLVLYNTNDPDSVTWNQWYLQQWGIPEENALGLDASLDEHLADMSTAQDQILGPVQDFFTANPQIEQRIMGIVVGYGLPGHFGSPPIIPDVGGYSIANALQDMTNTTPWEMNLDCPHMVPPYGVLPAGGRLTKATMIPGHYMTVRIDGPSLAEAQDLTLRAKEVASAPFFFADQARVWYDYDDPVLPGGE